MLKEKEDSSSYKQKKVYVYMDTHKKLQYRMDHELMMLEKKIKNYGFIAILALITGGLSLGLWIIF